MNEILRLFWMIMMLYVLDILNMNGILDILCLIYIGGLMGKFG